MSKLPKTMSTTLINKLNDACNLFQSLCNLECDDIGWCNACWIAAGGGNKQDDEDKDE